MAARPQTDQPRRSVWSDERLDDLATSVRDGFTRIDARLDHFENRVDHRLSQIDDRFGQVDDRFNQVGDRFNQVDDRFNQVDDRFTGLEARIDGLQRSLMIGSMSLTTAVIATLVAVLLKV
ncbi:MAG: hypothetical protein M9938_02020 [Solirubrobacterales bacterium]|nr:hypothetical protein [Solirubrobacterales bacterium]